MTEYNLVKLILLHNLWKTFDSNPAFKKFIQKYYNVEKIDNDYTSLLDIFLNDYALTNTEKSE